MSKAAQEGSVAHKVGELSLLQGKEPEEFIGRVMQATVEPHSVLGASGCKRWINCPAYPRLAAGVSAPSENLLHFTVNKEMTDAVTEYTDYIRGLAPVNKVKEGRITVWLEKKFRLDWILPDMFGTADCVVIDWDARTVHVIDYKHGKGVAVDPEYNEQLMYYGVGAVHGINPKQIDNVVLTVVQPRLYNNDEPVKTWTLPLWELHAWGVEVLLHAARATTDPQAPAFVGNHCHWCKVKDASSCPAIAHHVAQVSQANLLQPNLPPVHTLTAEQKLKLVESLELISSWASSARAHLQAEAEAGTFRHPAWKLVKAKTNRKYRTNAESILHGILNGEENNEPKLKSMSAIEKLLKEKGHDPAVIMPQVTEKPESGLTLVPASDPRPEVPSPMAVAALGNCSVFS